MKAKPMPDISTADTHDDFDDSQDLSLEDVTAANHLLEHFGSELDRAIDAVRLAAFIKPLLFQQSPPNLNGLTGWIHPIGTAIRCWPAGHHSPAKDSKTSSVCFSIAGFAAVLVDGLPSPVSLEDIEVMIPLVRRKRKTEL